MTKNYYEMNKAGKNKVRQDICDRAYREIPKAKNGENLVINLGYGIGMGIVNSMQKDKRSDIFLMGESNVIGMDEFLDEGDRRIDHNKVDPAGTPLTVHPLGAKTISVADSFAFINSGKIYATFLGAFQVGANGDLANWAVPEKNLAAGMGGAGALVKGCKHVYICMIEEDKYGVSKLVKECTLPLTGYKCVDLVITDKGVYKPMGDHFKTLETYNTDTGMYESVK